MHEWTVDEWTVDGCTVDEWTVDECTVDGVHERSRVESLHSLVS